MNDERRIWLNGFGYGMMTASAIIFVMALVMKGLFT